MTQNHMKVWFPSRKARLAIIFLFGVIMCFLRLDSFQVGTFEDDAHYVVLAESLANGQGYRLISYPEPRSEMAFPPGWPILLSSFVNFLNKNYAALRIAPLLLWLASIPLIFRLLASHLEEPLDELLMLLVVSNPHLIGMSGMLMAEAAYLFFSLVALNLYDEHWQRTDARWSLLLLTLAAAAAFYAQLIRTIGLSLMLAVLVHLLIKRRYKAMVLVSILFSLGLSFQYLFNTQTGGSLVSSAYEAQVFSTGLSQKVSQIAQNGLSYISGNEVTNSLIALVGPIARTLLETYQLGFLVTLLSGTILALILLGYLKALVALRASEIYVALYVLGILNFWNPAAGNVQLRFLLPIIPFLYSYILVGTTTLANWILRTSRIRVETVIVAISLSVAVLNSARNVQDWRDPVRNRITDISIGTSWLSDHAPEDAIVMSEDPVPAYLYARRKTIGYPPAETPPALINEYLADNEVDFIIVSPELQTPRTTELTHFVQESVLPMLRADTKTYQLVFRDDDHNVSVYQIADD